LNDLVVHFGQMLPYQGAFTSAPASYRWSPNRKAIRSLPVYFWAVYSPVFGTCQFGKLAYFFLEASKINFGLGKTCASRPILQFLAQGFGLATGITKGLTKEALP
jgi:hypothetical protein